MKELTPTAIEILESRYLLKNEKGEIIETPDQMFRRVAKAVAHGDASREDVYYNIMSNLEFLPNSPTLMNAGTDHPQMSACFVLPVPDDMSGIFQAVHDSAMIFKSGGGVGYDFSQLRPEGSIVNSTGGVASGPISFMKVFNQATEVIKQGGKRRGASMAILRCDHPDIEKFIVCKDKEGELANFNISVSITDDFMRAVSNDGFWLLIDPRTKQPVKTVKAKELYQQICEHAWKNGEPGVIFIDTINAHNPAPELGPIAATNPCGEQPLHQHFSCVLGSINLAEHVVFDRGDVKHYVDFPKIRRTVHAACWFLDDIIETSLFPLDEITRNAKQYRNIGLGIMGLADMLALMQIPYASDAGVRIASEAMSVIQEEARAWKEANNKPNRALTCIAPTGTISMIANVSAGCEPYFSLAYTKKGVLGDKELTQTSYALDKYLDISGSQSRKQQIISEVTANGGSIQSVDWIPKEIRQCFLTSLEIPYESHIQMQAALQEFTDAAVSKTINMPNNATVEDVHNAYMKAWLSGCKGITVYRSGSRQQEVISSSPTSPDGTSHFIHTEPSEPFTRPEVLAGSTSKTVTSFGSLWLVLNTLDGTPREVFCTVGKAGSDISAITEGYGRIISLALQHGVSIDEVCKQLEGIGGNGKSGFGKKKVLSLPDGIAKGIRKANEYTYYWHDKNSVASDAIPVSVSVYGTVGEDTKPGGNYDICPSCGATALINEAGCERCAECGYSRC